MNKESKRRADIYARELGCLICRIYYDIHGEPADLHHPAPGMKRISDDTFYAACGWHHRGIPKDGYTQQEMEEHLGPSIALNRKQFIKQFGTDEELLDMQEQVYQLYCSLSKT